MHKFIDAVDLFAGIVSSLRQKQINCNLPLDEIVIKTIKSNLAYVDNRRDAKEKYSFDFWSKIKKQFKDSKDFINVMKSQGINKQILYSKSEQFPDFLCKVRKIEDKLTCGSLLELKDSKGGSIASFNSTLPTKYKNLDEIDVVNGNDLVSKITSVVDGKLALDKDYRIFQRRNFYLIRTHKGSDNKVKISIVDGSFFETIPKEHLIYQMLLKIFREHLEKKHVEIPKDLLNKIEESLSHVTDQTIIAASQIIERASVRPRLRIMAEVHSEGNPHSSHYPEISGRSLNLIIQTTTYEKEEIAKLISEGVSDVKIFTIKHKRNGEHLVFQYKF